VKLLIEPNGKDRQKDVSRFTAKRNSSPPVTSEELLLLQVGATGRLLNFFADPWSNCKRSMSRRANKFGR
jgi:hypothetical protein